jgi:hypothetical protein
MSRSGTILEAMISYYSGVAMDAVGLMRTTREDLRSETYDWKRTSSRVASLWFDACEGWWSAMQASGAERLPTLLLVYDTETEAHSGTLKLHVPGRSEPQLTELTTAGHRRALGAREIRAEVQGRRDEVTVYLSGIRDPEPGTYEGFLFVDEQLLARVIAHVTPAPPDAPRALNKRAQAKPKAGAKAAGKARKKA